MLKLLCNFHLLRDINLFLIFNQKNEIKDMDGFGDIQHQFISAFVCSYVNENQKADCR